tara:strand:- start:4247 stop:5269 length:1023 start_codon:yes stop_codon:yes gene_type:complete
MEAKCVYYQIMRGLMQCKSIGVGHHLRIGAQCVPHLGKPGDDRSRFKASVNYMQSIINIFERGAVQKQRIIAGSPTITGQGLDVSQGILHIHTRNYKPMLAQLQTAVGLLYPPSCMGCAQSIASHGGLCGACWRDTPFIAGLVCDGCGVPLPGGTPDEVAHCDTCLINPPSWVQGRSALVYRDMGRKLVLALKHGDRQDIAKPAAHWMARSVANILPANTLIAPIPLHWRRMMKRRFNQSALLARALSQETGHQCCLDLLKRIRHTRPLEGKSRTERYSVLHGAIRVSTGARATIKGRPILLVDDVMTSGATLSCATRACIDAGAGPIRVVTLARVAKET